jgi:hypothetical protein
MADYLPGINVTLNDLGLKIAPPPAGPKVTLLGVTSNPNIKIREPYTVASVEKAMNTLYFDLPSTVYPGSVGDGTYGANGRVPGELALAIEEAINAGAPNVEVMVINILSGAALHSYIQPTTNHSGRYVDLAAAYEVLRNRDLDVVVPVGVSIDEKFTGNFAYSPETWNFGKQLADFCYRSTSESNSAVGVISVKSPTQWIFDNRAELGKNTVYSGEITSLFGLVEGGLPKTNLLTGHYGNSTIFTDTIKASIAAGIEFGVPSASLINEWQAYHTYPGDATKSEVDITNVSNYASSYLYWLYGAADQDGNMLSDTSATSSTSVKSQYFQRWQALDSDDNLVTDARGNKIDAGAYISVFSAPLRTVGTLTRTVALGVGASPANTSRNSSCAAAYAGKIASLAPQSSTTNKQIGGLTALRLLSARQANEMTGMRHVTMYSRTKGLTVASGITGAFNVTKYVRSDYTRLTTMRIVAAAADLIRAVGDKYIGEPNNAPQMNALDAEIDQLLLAMKGQGALNSYDFSISSTPDQRVLGQLDINLTLVPAFEIQEINLVVSLSKEL